MVGVSSVRMVSFNGSNWAIWKPRMEDFLCCKDLEGPLVGDSAKSEMMSTDEWKILDKKTVGYIRNGSVIMSIIMFPRRSQHTPYGISWRSSTRPRMQTTRLS